VKGSYRTYGSIIIVIAHMAFSSTIRFIYATASTDEEALAAWRILLFIDYPTSFLYRPINDIYFILGVVHWLIIWHVGTAIYEWCKSPQKSIPIISFLRWLKEFLNASFGIILAIILRKEFSLQKLSPRMKQYQASRSSSAGSARSARRRKLQDEEQKKRLACYQNRKRYRILGIVFSILTIVGVALQPWKIDYALNFREHWQTTIGQATGSRDIISSASTGYETEISYSFEHYGRKYTGREHLPGDPLYASRREARRAMDEFISEDKSVIVYYNPEAPAVDNGLENANQYFFIATISVALCGVLAIFFIRKARIGYRYTKFNT